MLYINVYADECDAQETTLSIHKTEDEAIEALIKENNISDPRDEDQFGITDKSYIKTIYHDAETCEQWSDDLLDRAEELMERWNEAFIVEFEAESETQEYNSWIARH